MLTEREAVTRFHVGQYFSQPRLKTGENTAGAAGVRTGVT
jgi:hypothetical protein